MTIPCGEPARLGMQLCLLSLQILHLGDVQAESIDRDREARRSERRWQKGEFGFVSRRLAILNQLVGVVCQYSLGLHPSEVMQRDFVHPLTSSHSPGIRL